MSGQSELLPPGLDDLIGEVQRELAMRARLYPKWVAAGTLSLAASERQTRRLHAVLELLRARQREPEADSG
jgi:hypothetical protein